MEEWNDAGQSQQRRMSGLLQDGRNDFQSSLGEYPYQNASGTAFVLNRESSANKYGSSLMYYPTSSQGSPLPERYHKSQKADWLKNNMQCNSMDIEDKNMYATRHPCASRQSQQEQSKQASSKQLNSPEESPQEAEARSASRSTPGSTTEAKKPPDNRYVNTMVALEKAGLLDITLQTADLIKKNEGLQKEIDVLEDIVKAAYALHSS